MAFFHQLRSKYSSMIFLSTISTLSTGGHMLCAGGIKTDAWNAPGGHAGEPVQRLKEAAHRTAWVLGL